MDHDASKQPWAQPEGKRHSHRTSNCIDIRLHIVYQYKLLISYSTAGTKPTEAMQPHKETTNTDIALATRAKSKPTTSAAFAPLTSNDQDQLSLIS